MESRKTTNVNKILTDPQLGEVIFRKNSRAKKYIIRIKSAGVYVTIPYGGNFKFAEQFFAKNRQLVVQKFKTLPAPETINPFSGQEEADLRRRAQQYLPAEVQRLALQYGFRYRKVQIRKSRTRWGSCSSVRTINLSFYLMLLPSHLIEYVLLHELCHTVELNHSAAFWLLLDKYTHGQSKALRKELRHYPIPR